MESYKYKSVDDYINHMPGEYTDVLTELRNIIKNTIPKAEEVISYNMPAYKYKRVLVYFALSKNHIGFYPTPSAIEVFKDKLKGCKFSKGAVQFPLNKPLPSELIKEMSIFRYEEELKNV